ncbi:hypothetical protein CDD81_6378 [Ophiocordyceps australis]|uniref:AMP-dependent synthetase/ligase domain-containing protein n=1 Tax=Ophiocordyceps australis TaxID=1399860 RepID=A0A2C5XPJ6_9HYPO|nr:hypothetical protein CDD81_6378 [Ophiocordyceps australis]
MYNPKVLCEAQCLALYHHLQQTVEQLLNQADTPLGQLSIASPWDLEQMTAWNKSAKTTPMHTCVHHLISEQVARAPLKQAIYTTQGILTYHELDTLSTQLAQHLHRLGVGSGSLVPFCMHKSAWAIVAMVAIMKADAAFVPLDPSHPRARREEMAWFPTWWSYHRL